MSAAATLAKARWFPTALGVGSFVTLVALIELLIRLGVINRYIVPMPSEILAAIPRVMCAVRADARRKCPAPSPSSTSIDAPD